MTRYIVKPYPGSHDFFGVYDKTKGRWETGGVPRHVAQQKAQRKNKNVPVTLGRRR